MGPFEVETGRFPICYEASNWFFDLLPLNDLITTKRDFLQITIREIQAAMGCTAAIDAVFAVDQNVLVAICLKERKIAAYRYQGTRGLCSLHTSSTGGAWIDAAGSVEAIPWSGSVILPYFFVLTKENTVIKISVQPATYSFIEEYIVTFDQQIKYKNILLGSKPQLWMSQREQPDNAVYLWAPGNKILQNWHFYSSGTGKLQQEVRIKRPKRTVAEGAPEVVYDPHALTMCVDEIEETVICADRVNHLLFECSMKTSHSEVLCGQGEPGCPEENTKTPLAFLNAPCAPLVLRPAEFISLDQFSTFSKDVITAEKKPKGKSYAKRPRMILVCDAGNRAVRKIWQFPDSPQAQDLAKLNRIYTMLSESEIAGCTGELLHMFTYAKIFLNAGAYKECIACCDVCLRGMRTGQQPPKEHVKILFTKSKAYRNTGRYQDALDVLREALRFVDTHDEIAYMQGSVLLRIGKVYSEYLMMISVSICFLQEAKDHLEKWLTNTDDPGVKEYVKKEYAICLDAMGQYWREKDRPEEAVKFFSEAKGWNQLIDRQAGVYRNEAHIMAVYLKAGTQADDLARMIRKMRYIIRHLLDDRGNQKGVCVRQLHLAKMQAAAGDLDGAAFSLSESRRMSRLYQDDKTFIKAHIVELQYDICQGVVDRAALMRALDLAKERRYYALEIALNQWMVEAIESGRMSSSDILAPLQRNRTLYLELSATAQSTIRKVTEHESQCEFFYLSEKNSANLLENVISDYEWFVQKMNDIINRLLKITQSRSDELTAAAISEAKASLASSVLHDLKHILTQKDEGRVFTSLDQVIDALERWKDRIPKGEYEEVLSNISRVNETLKESIYPRISEATRMPQDFGQDIEVYDVLFDLSRQKPEEYQKIHQIDQQIDVDCAEDLRVKYNYHIFATLMKELLRNAIDYQKKTRAAVSRYILRARENLGQISFSVLTEFLDERDAKQACHLIDQQLRAKTGEDGYGTKLLRNFMRVKTGNAAGPKARQEKRTAGIYFEVPQKS